MIFDLIIKDIKSVFAVYGLSAMIGALVTVFLVYMIQSIYNKRSLSNIHKAEILHLLLIFITLFNNYMIVAIAILSRPSGTRVGFSLQPFTTISGELSGIVYPIENVLLFIPLGVLLPLTWQNLRKMDHTLKLGLLLSMMVEVVQLVTKRGYFQTDDMLLNVLGTCIGYILFSLLYGVYIKYNK